MGILPLNYFCENRDGKLWVRGKCCVDRKMGELREDYSGWIVRDLDVPTPNVLCDEEGHLIWEVKGNQVVKGMASLTAKEEAARIPETEKLKARITDLEVAIKELQDARKA